MVPLEASAGRRNFTDLQTQPIISHYGWDKTNFQRSSQNGTVTELSSWLRTKCNECLNSIIWKFCHKVKCHCVKAVNTATAIAACVFNDGATALGEILQELELTFLCLWKTVSKTRMLPISSRHRNRLCMHPRRREEEEDWKELAGRRKMQRWRAFPKCRVVISCWK